MLERDFTDEQRYFIEKLHHHHQRLHGWGVVCGLKVKQHENPACRDRFVCIEPGTAIDCCGHEILVREEECIDITQLLSVKALIDKKDDHSHTLQVCLRYRECPSEEIPVLYDDCGCDDTKCAPNRILESYDVDILVDPDPDPQNLHTPKLKWEHTVNIAHAARVALHDATQRLYILTVDDPGTVYQLSTDNHMTITSRNLAVKGLALAVSNNGERVYVITEPVAPANVRQLHVLDTTKIGLPSINVSPIDIPNSDGSDIVLAVAPDNRLLALVTKTGNVLRWDINIDTQPALAAPTTVKTLGAGLRTLALSSDGKKAYAAGASNEIQELDIAAQNVVKITVLPAGANVSVLAIVKSTGPDMLAVANQNGNQMHLVAPNPPLLVGSVALDHTPVALAASPGGQWAYVLEQDTAASFVQTVSLHHLQLKLSPVVEAPFKVGDASQQIVVFDTGVHLYIPFTDDINKPAVGGVAVLDVSEQACEEILWRHLDGCPHCDMPNCVVLATIENYHLGDRIDDGKIDNRKGRRLLPSTQVLTELIECLLEHGTGGGGGTQGPPGAPGKDGKNGAPGVGERGPAGPGLEEGLTQIVALSWTHNQSSPLASIQNANGDHIGKGIVIGFNNPVFITHETPESAADHVFQVLVQHDLLFDDEPQLARKGVICRCPVKGTILPVKPHVPNGSIITSAQETSIPDEGLAFLFSREVVDKIQTGIDRNGKPIELWVCLRGDFVLDEVTDSNGQPVHRAVDAEFVRAELPSGDRPKNSKFGIQGGLFESWFQIGQG